MSRLHQNVGSMSRLYIIILQCLYCLMYEENRLAKHIRLLKHLYIENRLNYLADT